MDLPLRSDALGRPEDDGAPHTQPTTVGVPTDRSDDGATADVGYRYRAALTDQGGLTLSPAAPTAHPSAGERDLDDAGVVEVTPAATEHWRHRLEAVLARTGEDTDELPAVFPLHGHRPRARGGVPGHAATSKPVDEPAEVTVHLDLVEADDLRRLLHGPVVTDGLRADGRRHALVAGDADLDTDLDGYRPPGTAHASTVDETRRGPDSLDIGDAVGVVGVGSGWGRW